MSEPEWLTVGQAADLVGVSVRTLHHWDQIGLVTPSGRTSADYRVYSSDDIARLHQVLVYREVGIKLADIARILDEDLDENDHLGRQRQALLNGIARLTEMVSAVDSLMEAIGMGTQLTPQERAEILGTDWNPEYAHEAEARWGDTPQWAQSQERTAQMTKADWQRVKAEADALHADLGAAVRDGLAPGSVGANELAERHRASIDQYYDCTHSMQVCLGRMYLGDQRFTDNYEAIQPGLTRWLHDAIAENARAHGVDPDTAEWA